MHLRRSRTAGRRTPQASPRSGRQPRSRPPAKTDLQLRLLLPVCAANSGIEVAPGDLCGVGRARLEVRVAVAARTQPLRQRSEVAGGVDAIDYESPFP
eukprot:4849043-Pyramimonas_sp.AAC.1